MVQDMSSKSDRELLVEFMGYLNKVEVSDNDRVFRPNRISSCRVMDTKAMNEILQEAKRRVSGAVE